MEARAWLCVALLCVCIEASFAQGQVNLQRECPGNLIVNGGFEQPNPQLVPTEKPDKSSNSRWGWYLSNTVPGWYTWRPDNQPCVRVDWQGRYIEIGRNALATAVEGMQYGELLPNATGNYCQDVTVAKGQRYTLSYFYGRLMTYAKDTRKFTNFETSIDVAVRPAAYKPGGGGKWPADKQGFQVISSADTEKHGDKQWVRYSTTFAADTDKITLAFINTKRPKECGSCGSLLDAVCLTKA
jgi:hypothetical protein